MSAIPIRLRLTLAFGLAMAFVIGAMSVFVYVRVDHALLGSVDQTLRAQATEAQQLGIRIGLRSSFLRRRQRRIPRGQRQPFPRPDQEEGLT